MKNNKRVKNKKYQKAYYLANKYDEYEYTQNGSLMGRQEVHEIEHGSKKTYENWNMISLTIENHRQSHEGKIKKRDLFIAKIKNKTFENPPEWVVRRHDLQEYL